ncbi:suppressor of fused domain protein [Lentzea sp. HUAS12]|uniref:suppressor of fused domain protein n=1 Tax=Lentzea sp. HUAS12 TaxID=2951806 RepID=UPI00209FC0F4|nr:suppressor of fused domain protein [Lentzea sp. HUAS12]USX54121.1 suppressor of fused domain protein [Lentzea sp. HUAS12]
MDLDLPHDELHSREPSDDAIRYSHDDRRAIEEHYRRFFGGHYNSVRHEKVSTAVHVDVYTYGATVDRSYVTVATSGMGAVDVHWRGGERGHPVEIVTYLPADWDFSSPETQWLLRRMIEVARFPHEVREVIGKHHTWCVYDEKNGIANALFPGSIFTHWFFRSLIHESEDVDHLKLPSGRCVDFIWVYPITRHELHFGEQEKDLLELEAQLACHAPIPIDLYRQCLFAPEGREERRARKRQQKRLARSLPAVPWMSVHCDYHCRDTTHQCGQVR